MTSELDTDKLDNGMRLLDCLEKDASAMAIIAGEIEAMLKDIYEPDLCVSTGYFGNGFMTVWGTFYEGPVKYEITIFRCSTDRFNWAVRPDRNDPIILAVVDVTPDDIVVYDEIHKHRRYQIEDPDCFENVIGHVKYAMDCVLTEVESGLESMSFAQRCSGDFEEYGDLDSRLGVLKEKKQSFDRRFQSLAP